MTRMPDKDITDSLKILNDEIEICRACDGEYDDGVWLFRQVETTLRRLARDAGYSPENSEAQYD